MKRLSNKKIGGLVLAFILVLALTVGLLARFSMCEEWVGELPNGGMGFNQTCSCHGINYLVSDDTGSDGPRKYVCIGIQHTEPGQAIPESETDTD